VYFIWHVAGGYSLISAVQWSSFISLREAAAPSLSSLVPIACFIAASFTLHYTLIYYLPLRMSSLGTSPPKAFLLGRDFLPFRHVA
jgi:hypothetical protein